jgi:hypothetical protein
VSLGFNLSKFVIPLEDASVYRGVSNKNRVISGALVHQQRLTTVKNKERFSDLFEDILGGASNNPTRLVIL